MQVNALIRDLQSLCILEKDLDCAEWCFHGIEVDWYSIYSFCICSIVRQDLEVKLVWGGVWRIEHWECSIGKWTNMNVKCCRMELIPQNHHMNWRFRYLIPGKPDSIGLFGWGKPPQGQSCWEFAFTPLGLGWEVWNSRNWDCEYTPILPRRITIRRQFIFHW